MKRFQRILLLCGLLGLAVPTWAATATTTFGVSATVVPTCSVSAAPLNFGATIPNPINTNVDADGSVTATCSSGSAYTLALSVGGGAGATYPARRMSSGGNTLAYTLYTDAARSTIWGQGGPGTAVAGGIGTGAPQATTVYGRIPSGQTVPTGTYSDTVTVTITF